jgi:HAD superfamily hydrolase (TIGR01509 family)
VGFFDAYEAAIFDLDGTLVDSMSLWGRVCRDWLVQLKKSPGENLEQTLATMSLSQSAEYVTKNYHVDLSPAEVIGQWGKMVLEEYEQRVSLKPGAAELVRALAGRGMKLAVATSSFPSACESVLKRHGIREYFSAIVYTDEIKSETGQTLNKTFPGIWLAAAARIGALPEKCVIFEDMRAALKGGRAAGMGFVAVWDETSVDWPAFSAEADLALHSPRDALGLL